MWCRCVRQFPGCTVLPHFVCHRFVFMMMPLCLTVSWLYSVAILCVLQVCVHNRTCDAAVSDNFLGVQCCHAGAKHCLWEGTPSQRGKVSSESPVPCSPYSLENSWTGPWFDVFWTICEICMLPVHPSGVRVMSLINMVDRCAWFVITLLTNVPWYTSHCR